MNQKIYQVKRLVNGAMDSITEIIWPLFWRAQLYDQDILAVKIDFEETSVHQIDAILYNFQQNLVVEQVNVTVNFMLGMHSRMGFLQFGRLGTFF
jgi:hypothetical protein